MGDSFTFTEILSSGDGQTITLAGTDAPYAQVRVTPAFESGGTVEHEKVYFPGRTKPIYQVKQARERDLVLKGAFRDHLAIARDGVAAGTSHARQMRDQIEALRYRANPLRITWSGADDGQERQGLLIETQFREESSQQISYELTFAIAVGLTPSSQGDGTSNERTDTSDSSAQNENLIAVNQQRATALGSFNVSPAAVSALQGSLAVSASAHAAATAAAMAFESAPTASRAKAAQALLGAAQSAVTASLASLAYYETTPTSVVVPNGDVPSVIAWWNVRDAGIDDWIAILNGARNIAVQARKALYVPHRLYVVRTGDTLEQIARNTMGNAMRANELGVTQAQLYPGLILRIPQVQ